MSAYNNVSVSFLGFVSSSVNCDGHGAVAMVCLFHSLRNHRRRQHCTLWPFSIEKVIELVARKSLQFDFSPGTQH